MVVSKSDCPQLACMTFSATRKSGDICGSDGLPITPCSVKILGRAQYLKTLNHPNLCSYIDILKGKHERCVVVSEFQGKPVDFNLTADQIFNLAHDLLSALSYLHKKGIVHFSLSPKNILMASSGIKLFNYGFYYMTGEGCDVSFPIGNPKYMAPEVLIGGPRGKYSSKVDVWSAGLVLAELFLNGELFPGADLEKTVQNILGSLERDDYFLNLAEEAGRVEKYWGLPMSAIELIGKMLVFDPYKRAGAGELMESLKEYGRAEEGFDPLGLSLEELYHFWQLSGGDVYSDLRSEGLIRSQSPVLCLPNLLLLEGTTLGPPKDSSSVLDERVVLLKLEGLLERLDRLPREARYPLIEVNIPARRSQAAQDDSAKLPLLIREKDPEYQMRRVLLYRALLQGCPYKREALLREARQDIPPLVRAQVWAHLLEVDPFTSEELYKRLDKDTGVATDRQIEVDIPRCHQYSDLLASTRGHSKLRRLLKAWVAGHPSLVYWQGLDSLSAPFLFLNFQSEARAYGCLTNFIDKYLNNFFLKDNSLIIREYLLKFRQLIAFQDPELACHLQTIGFTPELFAIPWYLTMFSHVFPLTKIFHLWDSLLLGNASYPLYVGLAILEQLRPTLLQSGFNECILLFSDLPEIDIEKVVKDSVNFYCGTPSSVTYREHESTRLSPTTEDPLEMTSQTLADIQDELCPRICARELREFLTNSAVRPKVIVIDTRESQEFLKNNIPGSINIPLSGVDVEGSTFPPSPETSILFASKGKIMVVIGEGTEVTGFCHLLLRCHFPKVCSLHGGVSALASSSLLRPSLDPF